MHKNRASYKVFGQRAQCYGRLLELIRTGAIHIGTAEDGAPLYLNPAHLQTHLMVQAPTRHGKTKLVQHLLRHLPQEWAVVADDPKHDFHEALVQDCAALGYGTRTVVLDTSRPDRLPTFNPFQRNGVAVSDQALWLTSAFKAGWGQRSFEQTPQLLRWTFNTTCLTLECNGRITDALQLLSYEHSSIRKAFLARTKNHLLQQEWQAYEGLPVKRRREETASAFARLLPFCTNDTIQGMMAHGHRSLDLGSLFCQGGKLLSSFPRFRPLDPELCNILRSFLLQCVLATALHVPLGQRPPLVIILDEAEHAMERDTGVLETILNEGAELGIHVILLFHNFQQVIRSNPALLASVLCNCRTKIMGGRLHPDDLKILSDVFFSGEWHPYIVKDELLGLECEPVEETRVQRSIGIGEQESLTEQLGAALGAAVAHGLSEQQGRSEGRHQQFSHLRSRNRSHIESSGGVDNWAKVAGALVGPDGALIPTSGAVSGGSDTQGTADVQGEGETWGQGTSLLKQITQGVARSLVTTVSGTVSGGLSKAAGRTWQHSVSVVPWHAYRKRLRVVHREFLSLAEFLQERANKVAGLGKAHWAILAPSGRAEFFRAVWVERLHLSAEKVQRFWHDVLARPCYLQAGTEQGSGTIAVHTSQEGRAAVQSQETPPSTVGEDENIAGPELKPKAKAKRV